MNKAKLDPETLRKILNWNNRTGGDPSVQMGVYPGSHKPCKKCKRVLLAVDQRHRHGGVCSDCRAAE